MINHISSPEFFIVFVAVFLGCFVKGILGFGLPVIATPIMLFAMSLPKVIAVLFLPIVIANIQQMWLSRKHWKIVKVFWPLIFISTLFMLMLSTQIIVLNGHILATAIGIFILSHALLSIYPLTNFKTFDPSQQSLQKLILPAGMLSGILGGLTSMYSFPSLQLFLSMRVAKNDLTFLLGVFLSLGYVTIWLGIGSAGFPVDESLTLSMLMLVPTILGQQIGDRIRRRISEASFRRFVHFALATAGITLIMKNISEL